MTMLKKIEWVMRFVYISACITWGVVSAEVWPGNFFLCAFVMLFLFCVYVFEGRHFENWLAIKLGDKS
jgi:protein-S-isoprenylcysteine O-methyltransferase Ste14